MPMAILSQVLPPVLEHGQDGHGTNPESRITPILPKTPRITQGAPEKIRVKPFKILES
jgi:hypothetical protein